MKNSFKKRKLKSNFPLDEKEQDELIEEYLSEEEVEELLKAGFNKEQISYVAKSNKNKERIPIILDFIGEILSWIIPIK